MENLSLSPRTPGPVSPNNGPDKTAKPALKEPENKASGDFNELLQEESRLREPQENRDKVSKNQVDKEDDRKIEEAGQAADENSSEGPQALTAKSPEVLEGDLSEVLDTTENKSEQPAEGGNELPAVAIAGIASNENTPSGQSSKNIKSASLKQPVSASNTLNQNNLQGQQAKQSTDTLEAATNAEDTQVDEAKALLPEGFKNSSTNKSGTSKTLGEGRLNPAAIVQQITSASQLQQVAPTSMSAAINMNTSPAGMDTIHSGSASPLLNSIATPVQNPAWSQGLTEKISMMIGNQVHKADIKLNPANLGPLEIHLSLKDDQASINFVSQHQPVREALDQAMPRLRDMLEQQGFNLVNVDVSHNSAQQYGESAHSDPGQAATESVTIENQDQDLSADNMLNQVVTKTGGVSLFV